MTRRWSGVVADALDLAGIRGFVFDVDGTLLHRGPDGRGRPQPGAAEVLERIRASGRPLVLFTNASHVRSETIARGLREDGLPIADHEILTPVDSATTFLLRRHRDRPVLTFASPAVQEFMVAAGLTISHGEDAGAVFVAHVDHADFAELERAARAVSTGAPLLTGSYARGYAGANGIIYSRGAMITAAIAKVTGARPRILGKPSRAAVDELSARLGVPADEVAVIGDDLGMDIALGRIGGSQTILVRSGISGRLDLAAIPAQRRPDAVIDGVADLLARL
jgi:HAD superfamily hydrolase (TIGR01450 family)